MKKSAHVWQAACRPFLTPARINSIVEQVDLPALTDRDKLDLEFGAKMVSALHADSINRFPYACTRSQHCSFCYAHVHRHMRLSLKWSTKHFNFYLCNV
jgi:hypothetical protein